MDCVPVLADLLTKLSALLSSIERLREVKTHPTKDSQHGVPTGEPVMYTYRKRPTLSSCAPAVLLLSVANSFHTNGLQMHH
jgi:hypothetical protein